MEPTALDQLRPDCFDVDARVDDMNANGVLGSLCFPTVPGFCGELFGQNEDETLARATIQADNDWHIDEWCGADPGRFIPLAIAMMWDPRLLAEEGVEIPPGSILFEDPPLDEVLARWPDWEIDHDAAKMAHTSTVRGWKTLPARV